MRVQTLRGVTADTIIGEEAAYIDHAVWYEVMVPLMMMRNTSFILISTPSGPGTLFDSLLEARRANGAPLFKRLNAGVVCDSCLGTEFEETCTHGSSSRTEWNPKSQFEDAKALYGENTVMMRQELMGISTGEEKRAFFKRQLEPLFKRPRFEEPHARVERVYVSIDPNGGPNVTETAGSLTAIVSFFYDGGRQVVCGLDTQKTANHRETYALVADHIAALRAQPCFASARLVLVPEANLGNEAQLVCDLVLARIPGVEMVCQYEHAYGCWTTPTIPQAYVLRAMRRLDDGSVFFHRELVSANRWQAALPAAERARLALAAFKKQLYAFEKTPVRNKSLTRITRYAFSGKGNRAGERDGTKSDDLCMAWLIGTYWSAMSEIGRVWGVRGSATRLLVPEAMASASASGMAGAGDDRAFADAALGDGGDGRDDDDDDDMDGDGGGGGGNDGEPPRRRRRLA